MRSLQPYIGSPTVRAVAALSVTQLIGWGATFWLPAVTGPAMAKTLGMSLPMIMAGPTVMLVIMAMASWPLSTIFERHGARPVMVLGRRWVQSACWSWGWLADRCGISRRGSFSVSPAPAC